MIDKKKLEKIRQEKRQHEIEEVEIRKQMEIDALNDQLVKLQILNEKQDKELKKLKKINK